MIKQSNMIMGAFCIIFCKAIQEMRKVNIKLGEKILPHDMSGRNVDFICFRQQGFPTIVVFKKYFIVILLHQTD
ncbi:hypothetical protein [Oceanobacillus timonensis]|uniref:hypothetical protein n=1 Tax=Oceanobacillus timonensis TaxID=1926285 RepID=UPI0009BB4044|nr:hypothetical protein [Oceanobacillus timonensis]